MDFPDERCEVVFGTVRELLNNRKRAYRGVILAKVKSDPKLSNEGTASNHLRHLVREKLLQQNSEQPSKGRQRGRYYYTVGPSVYLRQNILEKPGQVEKTLP